MNLSIAGFGACMIDGFPLAAESGFLYQAVQHLRQAGSFDTELEIVTMGGFPVYRAQKHFSKRVLVRGPDVVVLQFGSTDAIAPLHRGFGVRHFFKKRRQVRLLPSGEKVYAQPPAPLDVLKWQLRNLGSELLLVPPTTPLASYLAAILEMVDECRAAGIVVVVLSPFVMGTGRSNRYARRYARALEQHLPRAPGVYFLDAHTILSRERRSDMLLRDGFHLSTRGHQTLAVALGRLLAEVASPARR